MEITNVNIYKNNNETFVANGSVEFDGVFFVKFKVVKSSKDGSLFISWPSQKSTKDDKYYPDAGYVLGEDEETKYDFKNKVDSFLIKEYNALVGMPSQDSKKQDEKKEDAPAEEKKKPLVSFKKK